MKILYVSNERGAAQFAAQALHGIAPDVRLTWTGSLSPALRWLQDNRDVAAVVLEADGQHQSAASFVEHVRGLGLTAPVVVVVPEHGGAPLLELKAGADDYVVNNQSLVADLPRVLTRALERTLAGPHPTKAPLRLLYVGDATLARKYLENPHWSIAITEGLPEADGTLPALSLAFDVVLVEYDHPGVDAFAILKDIAGRRLHIPVILVVEWDEKAAIPAFKLGAVDYVVKAADSFRALFFKLDRVPAASALTERAELNLEVVDGRERLERQLRDALATASDTERCFNTAAEHFRQSQARLQATIDQERASRETLEARLAEAEASQQAAERLALDEMAAAAAEPVTRQTEDAAALEASTRAALEQRVSELEAELERSDTRRALEATAAAEQLARVGAEFKVGLTNAFRARDDLRHQLHESTAALEASRRQRETESAAAAERLSRREAEAAATAADAAAAHTALEQELAQAAVAVDQAKECAAVERAALAQEAATRQAELENRLAEEAARRSTVEQNLANAETARQHAEQEATSELAAAETRLADGRAQHDAALASADRVRAALEQQVLEREAALEQAEERRRSEAAAAAGEMAERHAEFTASLAQAARSHDTLVQQLSETAAALEEARQNRTAEAAAAADHLTRREAEFGATLAEAVAAHTALEFKLTHADEALQEAGRRAANERATALQEAATRRTEFEERLTRDAAKRSMLEQHLATVETARKDAEERHASDLATAQSRVADRQAQYDAAMARAAQVRAALDQKLLELEAALRQADERHRLETMAFADRLAQHETELTASIEGGARARDVLAERLGVVAAALETSEHNRASEAAVAADRHAQLSAGLSEAAAARSTLERTLADVEAAHQHSRQRVATELATTAERQVELEQQLAQETARRTTLEQNLAHAQTAQQNTVERHATELAAAASHVAGLQAQYDAAVADAARTRDVFEQQLGEAAAALESARQAQASEAAAAADHLALREMELGGTLAEAMTARSALEQTLADVEAAHRQAQQRVAGELAAAAKRQTMIEANLQQEAATRHTLEGDLAETRLESTHARRRFLDVISTIRGRSRGHRARLEAQLTREQAERDERFAATAEEIRLIGLERESLQQSLGATEDEVRRLHEAHTEEHATYERARLASESELRRLSAEYDHVRGALDQVRASFLTLELASSQQVSECARLDHVVAERDSQLSAQAANHLATGQAADTALAQAQERLRLALEASSRDIAQLEHERDALRQELVITTAHREALRSDAERMPILQRQLDESQTEYRTQFEHAPYGMCRFNSDGEITHVNRSLVRVLGYQTADELRQVDFATTVFESADDMRWLIERCLSSEPTEPVETTWRNKDRGRVVVRLQAAAAANQSIELIAEDITSLRAVEDQLRRAQRMEAVGRLASEVAVTCDHLLRDVTQDGEQWLAAIGTDTILRHQGEHLLGEVTRAASFLRQLGVYGHTQASALEPVTVGRVLRDLEGVLKRVAGDDIELILPGTSPSVEVDVDAERVERVLVNVASYARERMPHGGRLKIELATVTVDRRFIAKYPNVRPGAHLLITVTEIPSTVRAGSPIGLTPEPATAAAEGVRSDRPGVDLGALLGLIGDCGGHVWMAAEPPGNMVLKIHLPTRISAEPADPHAPVTSAGRAQSMARWFRH